MKSSKATVAVVSAILAASCVVGSPADARAGAPCAKAGQVRKFAGVEHVCQLAVSVKTKGKQTRKLQWVRKASAVSTKVAPGNAESSSGGIELGQWRIYKATADAAKKQKCDTAGALSSLPDGTKVVCVDKYGDKRWALAPDATATASHNRLVAWLGQELPKLPRNNRSVVVKVEPTYRQADAAVIQQIIEGTKGFYSGLNRDFVVVLSTTAQFFYSAAREALGSRYDNASASSRAEWEFKWRASKMENMVGGGHAGISDDLSVIALKSNFVDSANAKADPLKRVVEDVIREYIMEIPRLEIVRHVDGASKDRQCWLLESTGWPLTLAVMEHFKVPGFNFAEHWAFWVSELADYDGSFEFGLRASEKSEGVANGNPTYSMPCQLAPGVGHIQGMLARELLHSKVEMSKFEAFVASDQSRQSLARITGIDYDSWIAESDSRTRALLGRFNPGMSFVSIRDLSPTPKTPAEADALVDVGLLLDDLKARGPAGGYTSAHEFFLAFGEARDRTQSGPRKIYEIIRDPLGLNASLVRALNSGACVLVSYDPVTYKASAFPAGMYGSADASWAAIPPNRRCAGGSTTSAGGTGQGSAGGVSRLPEAIRGLSSVPKTSAEALAVEDASFLVTEMNAAAPAGGYVGINEFLAALVSARDRSQRGDRRMFELARDASAGVILMLADRARACVLVTFDSETRRIAVYPAGAHTPNTKFSSMPSSYRCD
jgi:hypothetical protein